MNRRWLPLVFTMALGFAGCHSLGPPLGRDRSPATEPVVLPPPRLGAPVIPPPAGEREIGFVEALAIAGGANPTIGLAEEAVRASEAVRMQARALLLPTLNAGANVRVHQGTLLSGTGIVRQVNLQSLYVGAGAIANGAGTVNVPGVRIVSHLGDAVYAPQAAQQQVVGRQFDAIAVRQQTLRDVGTRYLELVTAHARLQSLRRSQEELGEVARITANFAKKGQGRDADAQRARSEALLLEGRAVQAEEDVAVAAAELSRLLDLDPAVQLRPTDAAVPLLELIDPAPALADLLQLAMKRHPELRARSADVAFAQVRIRQEHVRPWLPTLSAGASAGDFGGAGNLAANRSWTSAARLDFDVAAVWSLQNLGLGNRAVQNRVEAEAGEAEAERARTLDRIRAEVGEAYTLVQARRLEAGIARQRIESARKAFEADLVRGKNLEGRPIEVLRSLDLLTTARLDLIRTLAGYSEAQLRLYVALGNSPQ